MEYKPKNNLLSMRPDTIEHVYKSINLGKPGEMEEAIKMLREWVQKQPHFKRKDFTDNFLRSTIVASKGSIEASKEKLDKLCTLRTLMPDSFTCSDAKKDLGNVFQKMKSVVLPQLTKEHYRVYAVKVHGALEASEISDAIKFTLLVGDYMKQCDTIAEFIIVFDFLEVSSMVELITNLNLMHLRNALTVYFEGYGMRIKGIYFITTSKVINTLITILKQMLKPKLINRIKIFKTWDEVYDLVGKDVLPVDFGGYERSQKELQDDWMEALSSEDFKRYLQEINSATTDENCRPSHKFSEAYAGLPGTFRLLSVD